MTQKAYELDHDLSRFEEEGVQPYGDGYLAGYFDGWDEVDSAFYKAVPIIFGGNEGKIIGGLDRNNRSTWIVTAQLPGKITFIRTKEYLPPTDYLYIWEVSGWPIMSRKMLNVLLSVGNFPHQVFPVTFRSEETEEENQDYVILQLLELSDLLDMEQSIYSIERVVPDPDVTFVCDVKLKVLKEPAEGFPPIFRIKGDSIPLHVSAVAKQALENAGIQGLKFSTYKLETP